MTNAVDTWTDGFGRWYAAVPGDAKDPRRTARTAIRREILSRENGTIGTVRIESAPDHWQSAPREVRPVFREKTYALTYERPGENGELWIKADGADTQDLAAADARLGPDSR